jgi:hypothetical protein
MASISHNSLKIYEFMCVSSSQSEVCRQLSPSLNRAMPGALCSTCCPQACRNVHHHGTQVSKTNSSFSWKSMQCCTHQMSTSNMSVMQPLKATCKRITPSSSESCLQDLGHIQHAHPEDFETKSQLKGTHFPIWLTFPLPGTWLFHVTCVLPSPEGSGSFLVEHVQALEVVNANTATTHQPLSSPVPRNQPTYTSIVPPLTDNPTSKAHMAELPPLRAVPGAMQVLTQVAPGSLYQHKCHRLVFEFQDGRTNEPVTDLVPWLSSSMHVLIAGSPVYNNATGAIHLEQGHGIPEHLDHAVLGGDKQHGLDLCRMHMHHVPATGEAESFGPRVVLYARFDRAGPHTLFLQVRFLHCWFASCMLTLVLQVCAFFASWPMGGSVFNLPVSPYKVPPYY